MCGFMGGIGRRLEVIRGLPWLDRRGPDSHGVWSSREGEVSLLHCRLAIVDTDPRADQPFQNPKLGITVALNGEIYNYQSLRREFGDYSFRTQSDTEVVVAAYAAHGVAGFRRLRGMFTFALVDETRRRVFLVRDAVGKKPLYILRSKDAVLFGSSVLPLIACGGGVAHIDPASARFYWNRAYVQPHTSVIAEARPVLPGEVIELDWQGLEVGESRCEPSADLLYRGEGAEGVRRNVQDLLLQSVDRRLENNQNPAALLSGGIDSTVVSQIASERVRQAGRTAPLKVLTLGALIPHTKDEYYARYAARRLGIRLQIIRLNKQRLSDSIFRALSVQDEPLGMPSYFLLHQMVEAAARHGRVLMTGDGGDESFLGYRSPADWLSHAEAIADPTFVRVGPGPSPWMGPWAQDVTGSTLLGHMLAKADRASAEQGVEIRCPLLDWSLMCYLRSLPYEKIAGDGTTKSLLKCQLNAWPEWFVERPKLGFAFNLRWRWALSRFEGLRELVTDEAIETFGDLVPHDLRLASRNWTAKGIMSHFGEAWRLLVWSMFVGRLSEAVHGRAAMAGVLVNARPAVGKNG
jgi:asparagine synthase (glutamine-hydrolysing)